MTPSIIIAGTVILVAFTVSWLIDRWQRRTEKS